ncbi:MAG TPA: hypothetical protein VMC82_07090 [Thermoplasmata archaeon]|nr:hypothetical protein [Thermoplasmata archaeon]
MSADSNLFQDFVQAIADRHGQLDIRLEHLELRLPLLKESLELNGTISVTVHMRDLTDKEKQAHVAKEIRALSH